MKHMKPELMHIHAGSQTIPWDHFWNCHVVDLFLNWSSSDKHLSGLSLKKTRRVRHPTKMKDGEWWRCEKRSESARPTSNVEAEDMTAKQVPHQFGCKKQPQAYLLQHAADPRMIRTWSEHEWRPFPCPRDSIWIVVFECLLKCGFYEKTHAFFRPQLLQTAFWGWDTAKRMKLRNRSISARP